MEHGGDIFGVGEGVLGEKLFEVMDEELRVTIKEEKRSVRKGGSKRGERRSI